jgi:glycosyltransferase involved in cell wall biosynthesis
MDAWAEPAMVADEAGCGVVVAPGDPAALASAIGRLREDPALPFMGSAGRTHLERYFDRPRAAAKYEALLEHVVNHAEDLS